MSHRIIVYAGKDSRFYLLRIKKQSQPMSRLPKH